MTWVITAIALCVLTEALFSGSEIGFYSVNRLRLRSRVEGGWRGATVLQSLVDKPDATMMTTLLGTNLMVYAASALATGLLSTHRHGELIATLVMTPILFTFGEMIPKDLFRRKADQLMYVLAGPIDAFRVLAWPITAGLRAVLSALTSRLAVEQRGTMFSRAALREWIAEGRHEGVLSEYQHALSANVMDLLEKKISTAMIPLDQTKMVAADVAGEDLRRALAQTGHSRLPVYRGSRQKIVGILHALDYICSADQGRSAADLARPPLKVEARDGIQAVLVALQRHRHQMAVVLNRRGKPTGIVTVKDLVEEIVGDLQDF